MSTGPIRRGLSFLLALIFTCYLLPLQAYADERTASQAEADRARAAYDVTEGDFSSNKASAEKSELIEEIPDRRDRFQKEFLMENGMRLVTVYPVAVHYEENGTWEEIDNTLRLSEEDGEASYRSTAGPWEVKLPAELDASRGVSVRRDGHELTFRFTGELSEPGKTQEEDIQPEEEETEPEEQEATAPAEETLEEDTEPAGEEDPSEEGVPATDSEIMPEGSEENPAEGPAEDTMPEEPEEDPEESSNETEDRSEEDEYALQPVRASEGAVEEKRGNPYKRTGSMAEDVLEKNASAISYSDIYEKTDLRYDLISGRLKETVCIREYRPGLTGYRYSLDTDLVLKLEESGQILAYPSDGDDPVFRLPAPFLYDAERRMNTDVEVILEKTETGYELTYLLPREWLGKEDTSYPVSLDPVIQVETDQNNVFDQTVAEYPNATTSNLQWGLLELGKFPSQSQGGRERVFIKFDCLPELTSADVIVSASVGMWSYDADTSMAIEAHQVLGAWSHTSNISWSSMPSTNPLVEDYAHVTSDSTLYTWDITGIAQQWYAGGVNTGVMFRSPDAVENGSSRQYVQFYSSDWYGALTAPMLQLAYINNCGVENTWDYTSQSAGRAGTGYVNDYTGNLVWIHEGLGFSGNRMPVSIEHIYNANDKGNNSFGLGYGWRTNYNQLVYQWSQDSSYYVWEDGDGTRQYFKYKSSGLYENEQDSTVKLTNTGSSTKKYCITDGKNNKSYFDTYGRLTEISNYQQTSSSITISYSGTSNRILLVNDGVNRAYAFTYSSGALTSIAFKSTGSAALDTLTYTQTNGNLTGIGYRDNKTVSFTYTSNHLLSGAYDIDGGGVSYTYNQTAADLPNRISRVQQYGTGGASAGYVDFTYTRNQTTLRDDLGHTRTLQFNNWGCTTCVQNDLGQASASRYMNSVSGQSDNRKTGSQTVLASKLQDTSMNLVLNGNFEYGDNYWSLARGTVFNGSRSGVIDPGPYLGKKSLQVTQNHGANNAAPLGDYRLQTASNVWTYAQPGEVYTLSAYVKSNGMESGGGGAYISLGTSEDDHSLAVSERVTENDSTGEWKYLETTFVYPEDGPSDGRLMVFLHMASFGTVQFDCVQLEKSATAGRFNLIDNGDFAFPLDASISPTYWTRGHSSSTTDEKRVTLSGSEEPAPCLNGKVIRMSGAPTLAKTYYQDVQVSGSAGDVYTLAGWAKADSVPLRENRSFTIICRFYNTDNTLYDQLARFTPAVGRENEWQYAVARCVAQKNYDHVRILLCYSYNANGGCFDGIQLFREEFGQSYTYDANGNVTSVKDLHQQTTTCEYSGNDLTKIILPGNAQQTYTYDSCHNVTQSVTPEGVCTVFSYDQYGNNTAVQVGSGTKKIRVSATYSSNGNQLQTVTNPDSQVTAYSYDADTGVLTGVQGPGSGSAATSYSYDPDDPLYRLAGVTQGSSSVSYGYNGSDLLETLTSPSGTVYSYGYNGLYQPETVSIGSGTGAMTLITNTYAAGTHYLSGSAYGNGDSVTYSYDEFGRVKSTAYEDGTAISYDYNAEGDLGLVWMGNRTTRYFYDFQGELRGVDTEDGTDSSAVRWTYDTKNNLTKTEEKLNGNSWVTEYTYDSDNRVTGTTQGSVGSAVSYNAYNGITGVQAKNGNSTVVQTEMTYADLSETEATYRVSQWKTTTGGVTKTLTYGYDAHGNIVSISDGTNTTTYVYDEKDQLIRENDPTAGSGGTTWTYSYDAGGNLTGKNEYAYTTAVPATGTPLSVKTYSYGNTVWKDLLTGYNGATLSYDAIGNLTGDGTWSYTWEHGRQLAGMSKTGTAVSYGYDADGLRVSKTVSGTTTKYYYTGSQLTDLKKGNDTLHFTYDVLGPATVTYNGTVYYYLRNAQGDITGIVNSSGTQVVDYTYEAWGVKMSRTGSMAGTLGVLNPFRYRGYVYDEETELYYLKSRYYKPAWGRFINADSYNSTGQGLLGSNMFAYCNNNPINMSDSGGHLANWIIGGFVGGIVGGITAAISGENVWAGAVQGAVSGLIAGATVDIALATIASGGIVGVAAAGIIAFAGGYGGNVAGEQVHSLATKGRLATIDKGMRKRSLVAGALNVLSLGASAHIKFTDEGLSSFNQSLTPDAIIKEVKSNFSKFAITASDKASVSATLNYTVVGCIILNTK